LVQGRSIKIRVKGEGRKEGTSVVALRRRLGCRFRTTLHYTTLHYITREMNGTGWDKARQAIEGH
jgi:hypothetical protein